MAQRRQSNSTEKQRDQELGIRIQKMIAAIPPERMYSTDILFDLSARVAELLEDQGINQQELASRMGKTESEVSRILSGDHNVTIMTVGKLCAALGEKLLVAPEQPQKVETITKSTILREKTSVAKPTIRAAAKPVIRAAAKPSVKAPVKAAIRAAAKPSARPAAKPAVKAKSNTNSAK